MSTTSIRMSDAYGQTPPSVFTDFDWIHRNEKELLAKYGECSLIVYKEQVLGIGNSYDEALEDAKRNLSPDLGEITPVHRKIFYRRLLNKVRPKP